MTRDFVLILGLRRWLALPRGKLGTVTVSFDRKPGESGLWPRDCTELRLSRPEVCQVGATQLPAAGRLANASRSRCFASSDAAARSSPISAAPTTGTCRSTHTAAPGNSPVIRLVADSIGRALPKARSPRPGTPGQAPAP